jgi:hypothetical protein
MIAQVPSGHAAGRECLSRAPLWTTQIGEHAA